MKIQTPIKRKKWTLFLLSAFLLSAPLITNLSNTAQASQLNELTAQVKSNSGISYVTTSGEMKEIEIPFASIVTLSATVTTVTIKANNQIHILKDVQEISLKNLTISNFASFSTNTITKVSIEGVIFKRGVTFSKMQKLQTLIATQSTFGAINYSFSVDSAPLLETLQIDESILESDLLIYSNNSLSEATVSNSILKSHAVQQNNKKGYRTNYKKTKFERDKFLKDISSGGSSTNDIFIINPNNTPIGISKFNPLETGKIFYEHSDGVINTIELPALTPITNMTESNDTISIKLENGQTFALTDVKELYFRNVDIQTSITFTEKYLTLEKLQFVNSSVRNIHLANSDSLRAVEINNSEFLQSSGYVRIRENKCLETVVIQNSSMQGGGSTGYVMVYGSPLLKQFIMNNDYMSGYLYAKDIGNVNLQIGNTLFDDYISSTNVIEGEEGPQKVGYAPVITGEDRLHIKGEDFNPLTGVTISDLEDGDLSSKVIIDDSKFNEFVSGTYPIIYTVTDSDGNTTTVTLQVTVI